MTKNAQKGLFWAKEAVIWWHVFRVFLFFFIFFHCFFHKIFFFQKIEPFLHVAKKHDFCKKWVFLFFFSRNFHENRSKYDILFKPSQRKSASSFFVIFFRIFSLFYALFILFLWFIGHFSLFFQFFSH